ncbi:PREDICTED: heat shock 70 kDa protein 12A-like isoform X2 [Priapulus caudatus]|uniref:Heat shock 70 kDa protein 12A-like isoform X2 n=1 Tax=Priapulus caudatus TaxID=37621 RepID=A0ABM1EPC3_PRICU|nr:PREDICTED: heat shock 70 kDa protein 12A-like isoform X2 [Priapulus caudatus]
MSLPQFELTRTKFEDVGVDSGESGKSPGSGTRSREESVGGNSPAAPVSTVGSGNSSASYGAGVYDMFDGSADDDGDGKPTVSMPNRQDISTKASRPEAVLNEGEDKACYVGVSRTQKTPSPCREEAVYSVVDKSSKQTRIAPQAEGSHDPTITPAAATSRTRSDSASDTELPDDQRLPSNDYQEIDFKPAAIPRSDPATVIDQLEESCVDPGREGTWSEAMSSPDTASVYTQDESIEVIPQQGVDWVSADIHHDSRGATSSSSSIDSGHDSHQTGHFVVVAIDFGTTYSGYAFSFTKDADSIHMMRKWEGGDPGIVNQKTPTTVLLTPEGKFHSFGYAARDFFHDLDPKEAAQWLYFEKFKMALHHSMTLSRDTELAASNRKKVPAIHVFSCALRYFRDHALQELTDQSATKILNEDVRWVITVPAIWKQPAKQFMRHAAYEAGIASAQYPDQLLIALEPEAASIYCRKLRVHQLMPVTPPVMRLSPRAVEGSPAESAESVDDNVSEGTRYILVDCGGGTVDLTVHEMGRKHAHLKELYKATGGPHGSVGVDIAFLKLLNDIFGVECMNQFREKRPASFVDLMIAFESRKRNTSPFKDNPLNVSLPFSFIDFYKKAKGHHIEAAIRKYGDKDVSWSSQGMLRLMPSAMKRLFQPTVDHIKQHVGDALNNPSVRDITYLFLVGGFAESLILQQEVRKAFGHILKVIIPQDVSLSILKGAVLFGLDPTVVNVRRCRFTYGVGVLNRFDPAKHPENKRVVKDGVTWCADIFDKFVVTGQSVGIGDVVMRKYAPARCNQSTSVIHIYSSETEDPQFLSDPGTHHCGTLTLDLSSTASHTFRHEIQVRMTFGDTEIKVNAVNMATGKTVKSSIDFLCN